MAPKISKNITNERSIYILVDANVKSSHLSLSDRTEAHDRSFAPLNMTKLGHPDGMEAPHTGPSGRFSVAWSSRCECTHKEVRRHETIYRIRRAQELHVGHR